MFRIRILFITDPVHQMSGVHKDKLREVHHELYNNIDSTHGDFIDGLLSKEILYQHEKEELDRLTNQERNIRILHLLRERPDYCYDLFKQVLSKSGHQHLADLL